MTPSDDAYFAALPRRRVAAAALVRDPVGNVLLVELSYRADWGIPGGVVEAGEDPRRVELVDGTPS